MPCPHRGRWLPVPARTAPAGTRLSVRRKRPRRLVRAWRSARHPVRSVHARRPGHDGDSDPARTHTRCLGPGISTARPLGREASVGSPGATHRRLPLKSAKPRVRSSTTSRRQGRPPRYRMHRCRSASAVPRRVVSRSAAQSSEPAMTVVLRPRPVSIRAHSYRGTVPWDRRDRRRGLDRAVVRSRA